MEREIIFLIYYVLSFYCSIEIFAVSDINLLNKVTVMAELHHDNLRTKKGNTTKLGNPAEAAPLPLG